MKRMRFALSLLVASAWLGVLDPGAAAAQPVPLGPELRVDTLERKQPSTPSVAVQPDGDFEIAWGYLSDTEPLVGARHFEADGTPTDGGQVTIAGQGPYPLVQSVTATPGGFEVLWHAGHWPRQPHYRQHLDLDGVPGVVQPVRLGGTGLSTRWVWQVKGNGFLGGWQVLTNRMPTGLAMQRLTPAGRPTGKALRLNSRPVYVDERPILTPLAGGGFLAVWPGVVTRPGPLYISVLRARLFSPAGKPLGPDFDVSTIVPDPRDVLHYPKVATAPGGGFAVAWRFFDAEAGIQAATPYVRLFDAAGRPLGPEIAGPTTEYVEAMAFDDDGDLMVLWSQDQPTLGPGLSVQLFDHDGASQGPPVKVATAASGKFERPIRGSVAWSGSFWIVTWTSEATFLGPNAIFVRLFEGG